MLILQDSREQQPYTFSRYQAEVEVVTLPVGDYSLPGFEDKLGIERKSVDDLVGCLCRDRERFERELQKGKHMDCFIVVVEAHFSDLANGRFRSQMHPNAAVQSILAFQIRYRTNFLFAGNREWGEYTTYSLLSKYLDDIKKRHDRAVKAQQAKAA